MVVHCTGIRPQGCTKQVKRPGFVDLGLAEAGNRPGGDGPSLGVRIVADEHPGRARGEAAHEGDPVVGRECSIECAVDEQEGRTRGKGFQIGIGIGALGASIRNGAAKGGPKHGCVGRAVSDEDDQWNCHESSRRVRVTR